MKKKFRAIMLMLICVFALSACGDGTVKPMIDDPHSQLDGTVGYVCALVVSGGMNAPQLEIYDEMMSDDMDSLTSYLSQMGLRMEFPVLLKGMHSYADSAEDLGLNELEQNVSNQVSPDLFVSAENIEYNVKADEVVASAHFKTLVPEQGGHDGIVEVIFDENLHITSITVNTVLGLDESMKDAGINTLIGMGTVFIMLIAIAIIISLLKYVPRIVDSFKAKPAEEQETSVDKAIAGIVEREEAQETEESTDDTELVAVIAAAIAASEGAATVDGFVVRSIRRIR